MPEQALNVAQIIAILQEMPADFPVAFSDDESLVGVLSIWKMTDFVLLTATGPRNEDTCDVDL